MRNGVHTIRSGFTEEHNPTVPRKYSLDNGDYDVNMVIESVELIYAENTDTGGNQDKIDGSTVFFVIGTTPLGATPFAITTSPDEFGANYALRISDSRQIAWGTLAGNPDLRQVILDPENIVPNDLYVNAWSLSTGGSIEPVANAIGYIIKMRQVKSSGNQALLYQIRENLAEY